MTSVLPALVNPPTSSLEGASRRRSTIWRRRWRTGTRSMASSTGASSSRRWPSAASNFCARPTTWRRSRRSGARSSRRARAGQACPASGFASAARLRAARARVAGDVRIAQSARKRAALVHHPDVGGDNGTMRSVNEAFTFKHRWAKRCFTVPPTVQTRRLGSVVPNSTRRVRDRLLSFSRC